MRGSGTGHHQVLLSVAHAAAILAPRHFASIGGKVLAADVMVNANLSAAQAREKRLRLVRASRAIRIAFLMVDAARQIGSVQAIP